MSEIMPEKRLELVEEHLRDLEARERDNGKFRHERHERMSEDVGKLSRIIDNIAHSVDILEGRFEQLLKIDNASHAVFLERIERLESLAAKAGGDGGGSWNEQLDKCLSKLDALASPAGPEVPGALTPEKEHELREACRMLRQIWDGGHVRPNSGERMKLVCLAMPGVLDELVALRAKLAGTERKP